MSWRSPWCVELEAGIDETLARVAREQFSAWIGDDLAGSPPIVRLGTAQKSAAQTARVQQAALAGQMATALPGLSWRVGPLSDRCWAIGAADSSALLTLHDQAAATLSCEGPRAVELALIGLIEAFRLAGWLTLHAAAHQMPDGRACLSLGRSGAGKTGLSVARGRAGAPWLGEDRVWLRANDALLVARDRRVRLTPDAPARLGIGPDIPRSTDADGKLRFDPSALGLHPAAPCVVGDIEVLLAPSAGTSATDREPLPPAQRRLLLLQALWEAAGTPFVPAAQRITQSAIQSLLDRPARPMQRLASGDWLPR